MPVYLSSQAYAGFVGHPVDVWIVFWFLIVVLIAFAAKKEQR